MAKLIERAFGRTLTTTENWLSDLMKRLETSDPEFALRVLRETLHLLRDRLTSAETVQLGAQLPMLIRGLYYEGWTGPDEPLKYDLDDFLGELQERIQGSNPDLDVEPWVRAVFALLSERISSGEIADVKGLLPASFEQLWGDQPA